MTNENTKKLVPKLRFPEFKNDKTWRIIKLIDTVNKKIKWSFTGGPFGSDLQSSDYTNQGIRIIQLQNMGDAYFNNDYKIYTSKEKADELLSCNIYPNDIILSKMGDPVGRACIIPNFDSRYVMCSDGIRIVIDEKKYDKYFIYSMINSKCFRKTIQEHATGSTRKRIGLNILKNLNMIIPDSKKEQQKIADCLNSLDELIELEGMKLDELKEHKKGLIQKLFPQEGKTIPELRFPEFKNDKDWEDINLKAISEYKNGGSFENNIVENGKYNLITLNSIDIEGNLKTVHKKVSNADWYLCKNDLVMVLSDVARGDFLGLTDLIPQDDKYVLNQRMGLLKIIDRKNHPKFIRYYINLNQKYFKFHGQGSNQKNLSKNSILNFIIKKPIKDEQKKISDCLTSLDDLITAQAEKVESLKEHKKGLMQGLFPTLEEVCE